MTVEIDTSGPGTSAWQSTRFTATVNGNSSYVYGSTRTTINSCSVWNYGDSLEMSWLKFGSDATTTVAITRLAGAVTSAIIYPNDGSVTQSINSGVITLTVPTNRCYRVEFNGDRKNVLHIFSQPLKTTVPASRTDWTTQPAPSISGIVLGTGVITTATVHGLSSNQPCRIYTGGSYPVPASGAAISDHDVLYATVLTATTLTVSRTLSGPTMTFSSAGASNGIQRAGWTDTVNALYFGAGVHYPGMLFKLANNVTVYIDRGAVLVGSFDLRGCDGVSIKGPGVLAGTFETAETVQALGSYEAEYPYSMLLGYDGSKFTFDNTLQGITVVRTPFYLTNLGIWSYRNVQVLSPWSSNSDGFDTCARASNNAQAEIVDCFVFCGDDCIRSMENLLNEVVSGTMCVAIQAGCLLFSYWATSPAPAYSQSYTNCHFVHLGKVDTDSDTGNPASGANAIIKCWLDGDDTTPTYGRFNVTIENCFAWGPIDSRLFSIINRRYLFNDADVNDEFGNASGWVIDGLTTEYEPAQLSMLRGFNWEQTPHDFTIDGLNIAGVDVNAHNWLDYVEQNAYPYNIIVGGLPVVTTVDLVNIALAHIGEGVTVTSIAPPDGSAQSIAAARFLTMAITETLGSVAWPFASTRAALVEAGTNDRDDVFDYCYDIPSDCVRVLGLVPEGAKDSFLLQDGSPVEFQAEVSDDGTQRIYTDLEDAQIRYTKYVSDPNKWTPQFQYAFTWMLASMMAGSIVKGDAGMKLGGDCLNKALLFANAAAADASTRREVRPSHVPPWFMRSGSIPDARILRP